MKNNNLIRKCVRISFNSLVIPRYDSASVQCSYIPVCVLAMKYNFDKVVDGAVDSVGEPYDYGSIMHYPFNAFSKDWNKDTIVPRRPLNGKKPYVELSDSDARQANIMYKCSG